MMRTGPGLYGLKSWDACEPKQVTHSCSAAALLAGCATLPLWHELIHTCSHVSLQIPWAVFKYMALLCSLKPSAGLTCVLLQGHAAASRAGAAEVVKKRSRAPAAAASGSPAKRQATQLPAPAGQARNSAAPQRARQTASARQGRAAALAHITQPQQDQRGPKLPYRAHAKPAPSAAHRTVQNASLLADNSCGAADVPGHATKAQRKRRASTPWGNAGV